MLNHHSTANNENLVKELILQQEGILLDVRTHPECAGHSIKGAINISSDEIDNTLHLIEKWNRPIYIFSTNGRRSAEVTRKLQYKGIEAHDMGTLEALEKWINA